eukprot:scaffold38083_cov45-Phaeocystis_antarctica.AAC.1
MVSVRVRVRVRIGFGFGLGRGLAPPVIGAKARGGERRALVRVRVRVRVGRECRARECNQLARRQPRDARKPRSKASPIWMVSRGWPKLGAPGPEAYSGA